MGWVRAIFRKDSTSIILLLAFTLSLLAHFTHRNFLIGCTLILFSVGTADTFLRMWRLYSQPEVKNPFSPAAEKKKKFTANDIAWLSLSALFTALCMTMAILIFLGKIK